MNVMKMFNVAKKFVIKESPKILAAIGIAGFATTVVLTVKATPVATKKIEEKKEELGKEKLTVFETADAIWKPCVAPALSFTASTACVIGSQVVSARRYAALAAAYKISETALIEFKKSALDSVGEETFETIEKKANTALLDKNPAPNGLRETEDMDEVTDEFLIFDPIASRYFHMRPKAFENALNRYNRNLDSYEMCSLNDLYDELQLPGIDIGDDIGWNKGRDDYADIRLKPAQAKDGRPCLKMTYEIPPKWDYYHSCVF